MFTQRPWLSFHDIRVIIYSSAQTPPPPPPNPGHLINHHFPPADVCCVPISLCSVTSVRLGNETPHGKTSCWLRLTRRVRFWKIEPPCVHAHKTQWIHIANTVNMSQESEGVTVLYLTQEHKHLVRWKQEEFANINCTCHFSTRVLSWQQNPAFYPHTARRTSTTQENKMS